jgi:hypothetical protein
MFFLHLFCVFFPLLLLGRRYKLRSVRLIAVLCDLLHVWSNFLLCLPTDIMRVKLTLLFVHRIRHRFLLALIHRTRSCEHRQWHMEDSSVGVYLRVCSGGYGPLNLGGYGGPPERAQGLGTRHFRVE